MTCVNHVAQGVFYTNFPYPDAGRYADSVARNEPWANIVWWPTGEGRPVYQVGAA